MDRDDDFLPLKRNYKNLTVYQIAECIDVVTYYFATTPVFRNEPHKSLLGDFDK